MITQIKKTQITQILKTIAQIRFCQGYGDATVTKKGIVIFAVAVTKVDLCNLIFNLCNLCYFLIF